jgi:gliding motility-associated-like protein
MRLANFTKFLFLLTFIFGGQQAVFSQLPDCNSFYIHSGGINTINPVTYASTPNSIAMPPGGSGLAVSNNLNAATPATTFYTVVGGIYWYYNGTNWVSTGHSAGSTAAVNPGGAGPYIYNLVGGSGTLYRYDGTGNSTVFLVLPGFGGPYDVIGDQYGNVYVMNNSAGNQNLKMYNPAGQLVCTYTFVNLPPSSAGGGYAIVNGVLYVNTGTNHVGTISGTVITFTPANFNTSGAADFANCPFPLVALNLTPSSATYDVCLGVPFTISGTTSVVNPTWSWTGPGIVSGANTSTITVNQAGIYTANITSPVGCSGSATNQYTVVASGTSPPVITQPTPKCVNASAFPLVVTGASGTYSSSCGPCLSSTGVFDPAVAGVGSHTVTYTTTGACAGSNTKTIVVNALPIVSAGIDQTVCIGTSVNLVGSGAATYVWSSGATIAATTVTPTVTSTYSLVGTDTNGCVNNDAVTVTLEPLPIVNAGIDVEICADETVTLTATGAASYVWNNGVVNGVSFQPTTSQTYTVIGASAFGCFNQDAVQVIVNPRSTVSFTGTDLRGCDQVNPIFQAVVSEVNNSFLWEFGDGQTSNDSTLTAHTYNAFGCYDVKLTVTTDKGCVSFFQIPDYVCMYSSPVANFMFTETDLISYTTTTDLLNLSTNAVTYQWDFGDGSPETDEFSPTHTFPGPEAGGYIVILIATSADGCTDTIRKSISVDEEIIFYIPNAFTPDGNEYNNTFKPFFSVGVDPSEFSMLIYNRWGQVIFESNDIKEGWDGTFNGELVQDGLYTYSIVYKVARKSDKRTVQGHFTKIK